MLPRLLLDPTARPARCADAAAEAGLGALGTATPQRAFLLIELALPWPKDVLDHPELAGLRAVLPDEGGVRVQAVRAETFDPDRRAVIACAAMPPPGVGYRQASRAVPPADIVGSCLEVLADATSSALTDDPSPTTTMVDLLICTHGQRDVCCGSFGMALAADLLVDPPPGVRVWRTSHLGGHRHAPTALTFPDGHMWARLDRTSARQIATRSGDAAEVAHLDRGACSLSDCWVQAADSTVLAVEGWSWLTTPRHHRTLTTEGEGTAVRIRAAEDTVVHLVAMNGRAVHVPDGCRKDTDAAMVELLDISITDHNHQRGAHRRDVATPEGETSWTR